MESTTFHGQRTNTFPLTVVHAGLKELPALLLTGSTSSGTEPGLTWLSLLKSSSTAKQEEAATEEILLVCISMLRIMEFLRKAVRTILPRILINSVALTFRSVKTALIPKARNQETKETVGPLQSIQSGKSLRMDQSQELIT